MILWLSGPEVRCGSTVQYYLNSTEAFAYIRQGSPKKLPQVQWQWQTSSVREVEKLIKLLKSCINGLPLLLLFITCTKSCVDRARISIKGNSHFVFTSRKRLIWTHSTDHFLWPPESKAVQNDNVSLWPQTQQKEYNNEKLPETGPSNDNLEKRRLRSRNGR